MPGNHSEISLNEQQQNGGLVCNDDTKTTRKKKKKKDVTIVDDDDDEFDGENQLVMVSSSSSKSRNRFISRILKKPKSPKRSGSRKGGCFRVIRPRRREKSGCGCGGDDGSSVSSPVSDPNDERFSHEMLRGRGIICKWETVEDSITVTLLDEYMVTLEQSVL
ncbi:uncharacterized protein LOC17882743 isoform X1 [Capsella rubella]|uniref:uncharacterized protein LOC17882743 isoform X1 n=1 Tax=Capsella rubella TaxID=81985 RepID=UPI000CD5B63A|nr:uncharacterized protein LOC17882743 isoform X1 [Capsella rubella]